MNRFTVMTEKEMMGVNGGLNRDAIKDPEQFRRVVRSRIEFYEEIERRAAEIGPARIGH